MPLFEYRCGACRHLEELLQKHGDVAPERCPACKKKGTMTKEISLTSFQLKGGGWYKDLYASTPAGGADSGTDGASDGKSDSKSDSKSDGKSDGKSDSPTTKADAKPAADAASKSTGSDKKANASKPTAKKAKARKRAS